MNKWRDYSLLFIVINSVYFIFLINLISNQYSPSLPGYSQVGGSVANGNTLSDDVYKVMFSVIFAALLCFTLYIRTKSIKKTIVQFIIAIPIIAVLGFLYVLFFLFGK